ncbi:MAG: hypothetical protein ACXWBT_14390 [Usitatibacter sp.]
MPRKKTAPPKRTPEQLKTEFEDIIKRHEVEGAILVAVVDGMIVSAWGVDSEGAALSCVAGVSRSTDAIATWMGRGGVRPSTTLH